VQSVIQDSLQVWLDVENICQPQTQLNPCVCQLWRLIKQFADLTLDDSFWNRQDEDVKDRGGSGELFSPVFYCTVEHKIRQSSAHLELEGSNTLLSEKKHLEEHVATNQVNGYKKEHLREAESFLDSGLHFTPLWLHGTHPNAYGRCLRYKLLVLGHWSMPSVCRVSKQFHQLDRKLDQIP